MILLPETSLHAAETIVERIRADVSASRLIFDEQPASLTLSAGVVSSSKREKDFLDLLQRADSTLYAAKQQGRNCVVTSS